MQSLFAMVQVQYDFFRKGTFVDQIVVSQEQAQESFSNGGDSGSLVYDLEKRCIGLLFGGSEASGNEPATTIVNPIQHVLRELNVELLASGAFPSPSSSRGRRRRRGVGRGV